MSVTVTTTTMIGVTVEQPGLAIYNTRIIGVVGVLLGTILGQLMHRRALVESISLQKEERRRERLSEGIYRPLLGQVGRIREQIFDGESPDLAGLERTMQDGMFYIMDEKVRKEVIAFSAVASVYKEIFNTSRARSASIVREEIRKLLRDKEADLEKYQRGGLELVYRAFIDHLNIGIVSLRDCVFLDKTPLQILREKTTSTKEASIETNIGGHPVSRELADIISESALERAKKDDDIVAARTLRQNILRNTVLFQDLEKLV